MGLAAPLILLPALLRPGSHCQGQFSRPPRGMVDPMPNQLSAQSQHSPVYHAPQKPEASMYIHGQVTIK